MKIIIIGTGWYGCHIASILKDEYDILLIDKKEKIFDNSSNYNQNRLHLGYHYPRCSKTRDLCLYGYKKFIQKYRELVEFIDENYYMISKSSNIDFNTYIQIYNLPIYKHSFVENTNMKNIDGDIIKVDEKIINSEKSKIFFMECLKNVKKKMNYKVSTIEQKDNKVIVNNDLECDIVLNCSYNSINLSNKECIYELTISLIYERINFNKSFDSLTLMDGDLFSLFPRDISRNLYTLTHVKYTPILKTNNIKEIENYIFDQEKLENIKKKIINEVVIYYEDFEDEFNFKDFFLSYKCKSISKKDSRDCQIIEDKNIISVHCGKIIGIFEFEEYVKNFLKKKHHI